MSNEDNQNKDNNSGRKGPLTIARVKDKVRSEKLKLAEKKLEEKARALIAAEDTYNTAEEAALEAETEVMELAPKKSEKGEKHPKATS